MSPEELEARLRDWSKKPQRPGNELSEEELCQVMCLFKEGMPLDAAFEKMFYDRFNKAFESDTGS